MEKLIINGGKKLSGEVFVSGAKNAVVAILPAALLSSTTPCIIENIPDIEDVSCLERILEYLGCDLELSNGTINIDSSKVKNTYADIEDATKMRASYYLIGALLARFKHAKVALPGGCPIGVRPIDQHIKGFEALGAKVKIESGSVNVHADKLIGANIFFDVISVGATINVMIAATMAEGVTVLENVAREPHVVDVANFLNSMGANIKGAGTDVIKIHGVTELHGCNYSVIPDQIEAGTFMIAAAACGGDVTIRNIIPKHMESVTAKLLEIGAEVIEESDSIIVRKGEGYKGANIKTLPYPGFPTDLQQPMTALLTVCKGKSIVNESVWESRFKHVDELKKMGAIIDVQGRSAYFEGCEKLTGARLEATDLRAGAALVIAAMMAEGDSEIYSIEHIDRGYPNIENKFNKLGANIKRVECENE